MASRDDMLAILLQVVVIKVAYFIVEVSVLSGSHALRPMQFVTGARFGETVFASVHDGQAHFLVLGEFYQVASED